MNAVPTSGIAISAATPAAPPARAAGRSKPAPPAAAIAEAGAGGHAEIRGGRLGPHRRARARRWRGSRARESAPGARGSAPPRPALSTTSPLMSARTASGGNVRQAMRRAAGRRRRALAEPVQHQHGDRQPEQRHHDDVPGVLAGDEVHPRLEHQGHADDEEPADQSAQQRAEDGGADARPARARVRRRRSPSAVGGIPSVERERIGTTQLLATAQGDERVAGGDGGVVARG